MTEQKEMTEAEAQAMIRDLATDKANAFSFMKDVIMAEDTTRLGNLSVEELGESQLEQRGMKELELICRDVLEESTFADFFKDMAQIQTETSLSREGFFMRNAVTIKKEMADTTMQERKKNKGWFKKS